MICFFHLILLILQQSNRAVSGDHSRSLRFLPAQHRLPRRNSNEWLFFAGVRWSKLGNCPCLESRLQLSQSLSRSDCSVWDRSGEQVLHCYETFLCTLDKLYIICCRAFNFCLRLMLRYGFNKHTHLINDLDWSESSSGATTTTSQRQH